MDSHGQMLQHCLNDYQLRDVHVIRLGLKTKHILVAKMEHAK